MQQHHLFLETSSQIEEDRENKISHLVCVGFFLPPTVLSSAFNFSEGKQVRRTNWRTGREGWREMRRGHTEWYSKRARKGKRGRSASARINFPDPEFISSISTQIEAHTHHGLAWTPAKCTLMSTSPFLPPAMV